MRQFLDTIQQRWIQFQETFKARAENNPAFSRRLLLSSLVFLMFFVLSSLGAAYLAPVAALAVVTGLLTIGLFVAHRQADAIYGRAHPGDNTAQSTVSLTATARAPLLRNHPIMQMQGYGTASAPTADSGPASLRANH